MAPRPQGPAAGGWETPLLVLAGLLLGSALIFLVGAHTASIVFAGGGLNAGLSDVVEAMLGLPSHLADPKRAWPAEEAAALPGPIAYWASFVFVLVGSASIAVAGYSLYRRFARLEKHAVGVESHPGLAKRRHTDRLRVRQPTGDRITLGRLGRQLVAAEPQASLAVIGPSGYGKTSAFAVPNLLEWEGPVICTSVKTDLVHATLDARRGMGKAWVFDPTMCSGVDGATWSPLSDCSTWSQAGRYANWLTEAASAKSGVTEADYWYTQGRNALAPHLYAAAAAGASMRDVYRWVITQEQDVVRQALRDKSGLTDEIEKAMARAEGLKARLRDDVRREVIEAMRHMMTLAGGLAAKKAELPIAKWDQEEQIEIEARTEDELDRRIRPRLEAELLRDGIELHSEGVEALLVAEGLWAKEERLRGSIYATVENVLLVYGDPLVGRATDSTEIDLDEWLSGPNTIYVVANADEQSRLRPMLAVLVQAAIRRAYETANMQRGTLERPCLVLLDEAGNIAPLPDLPVYASTARSHGISLVTIWQDLAQVSTIYGDRAQTVLNNHRAKIVLGGIADGGTLDWVSRLAGEVEVVERNWTGDGSGMSLGRRSVTEHTVRRRTIDEDVLRRLPENEAVLLYGSLPAAHLRLRPWFNDRRLRQRVDGAGPSRSGARTGHRQTMRPRFGRRPDRSAAASVSERNEAA